MRISQPLLKSGANGLGLLLCCSLGAGGLCWLIIHIEVESRPKSRCCVSTLLSRVKVNNMSGREKKYTLVGEKKKTWREKSSDLCNSVCITCRSVGDPTILNLNDPDRIRWREWLVNNWLCVFIFYACVCVSCFIFPRLPLFLRPAYRFMISYR